jgi:hypothetical protein
MNRQEFECDSPECRFWDENEGCTKQASITIQEHCCVDFEEKPRDSITIEIGGGMVQSAYTTLSAPVEVVILDFDDNGGRTERERMEMRDYLKNVAAEQRKIY